jgi:hypothetical protein
MRFRVYSVRYLVQTGSDGVQAGLNLVLYGISGALGLLIAFGSVRGFIAWNPFGMLPAQPVMVSLPVLGVLEAQVGTCAQLYAFGKLKAPHDTEDEIEDEEG